MKTSIYTCISRKISVGKLLLLAAIPLMVSCSGLSKEQRNRIAEIARQAKDSLKKSAITADYFVAQGIAADFSYPFPEQIEDQSKVLRWRTETLNVYNMASWGSKNDSIEIVVKKLEAYNKFKRINTNRQIDNFNTYLKATATIFAIILLNDASLQLNVPEAPAPVQNPLLPAQNNQPSDQLVPFEVVGHPDFKFDRMEMRKKLPKKWAEMLNIDMMTSIKNIPAPNDGVKEAVEKSGLAIKDFTEVLDKILAMVE